MDNRKVRVQAEGLSVLVHGLVPLVRLGQGNAEVVVGQGSQGYKADNLPEVVYGLVHPVLIGINQAESVVDESRVRPNHERRSVVPKRFHWGRPKEGIVHPNIGPEVLGIGQHDPPDKGCQVATAGRQPSSQRRQNLGRLLGHGRRRGQLGQHRAVVPRDGIADLVAPGVRVGDPRDRQHPDPLILIDCEARPVVQGGQQGCPDRRCRHARCHLRGVVVNSPQPRLTKHLFIFPTGGRQISHLDAIARHSWSQYR